jgi:DNA-binding LacI/PurR family transcriptional regulator
LATGLRHSIALVTPDLADPFFAQVAMGVTEALEGRYQLVLLVANGGPGDNGPPRLDEVLALRVDGMLLDSTAATLLGPDRPPCPAVILDAPGPLDGDGLRVDFDLAAGVEALVAHLVGLGHRRFGYLDWVADSPTFLARRTVLEAGIRERLGPRGTFDPTRSRVELDDAERVFRASWPTWEANGVSAVICATDLQAYGVMRAARDLGIAIPGHVSVAGFNDLEFSAVVDPPLTSVALPAYDLGLRAAALLRRRLEHRRLTASRIVLPTTLMVRASTGPVPGPRTSGPPTTTTTAGPAA